MIEKCNLEPTGREVGTSEVKRQRISEVTDAISRTLGNPSESVRVLLYEVLKEDWGVGRDWQNKNK